MGNEANSFPWGDRRRGHRHRHPARPRTPWIALVGPNRWAATILNISADGIALALPYPYPRDYRITIELFNPTHHRWHQKSLRVTHCTPRSPHAWIIGGTFVNALTPEEPKFLLPTSSSERRCRSAP
jgi:hypothetical protein